MIILDECEGGFNLLYTYGTYNSTTKLFNRKIYIYSSFTQLVNKRNTQSTYLSENGKVKESYWYLEVYKYNVKIVINENNNNNYVSLIYINFNYICSKSTNNYY